MIELLEQLKIFLGPINPLRRPEELLDLAIVAALGYAAYRFIQHTRAVRILYGIAVLLVIWLIGRALELTLLNTVLRWLITSILVAIPVVFQPELRAALERVGRTTRFVTDLKKLTRKELTEFVGQLMEAVRLLVRHKLGSIIVISRGGGLQQYLESGQPIEARLSADLILSIFLPKSPLHDGAIIIEGNKIVAAGVTLPIAQGANVNHRQGTRHKAALGIAQEADVIAIVVSEEDQTIELAFEGALIPVDGLKDLGRLLTQLLRRRP